MLTIYKWLHERPEKSEQVTENHNDDAETIFEKMVADKLRPLSKRMKIMLKDDINESIFQYQMQLEEHESKASKLSA